MNREKHYRKKKLEKEKRKVLIYIGILLFIITVILISYRTTDKLEEGRYQILKKYLREDGTLIYGANKSAPPLRYLDTDGVYKGVVVDYISQLSLELGINIQTEPYEWESALEKLKEGETDLCDMFINDDRKKVYVFTVPIYNLRTVLAVQEDSQYTFDDINYIRIATEKGDYANTYIKNEFPSAEVVFVDNVKGGMELLALGEVDAVIGDEPIVSYYIDNMDENFRIINIALYEESVVLALPKSHEELLPVINHAIEQVNNKGQLEKIQQKWFGISTPLIQAESENKYIKWILLCGAGLLALIGLISLNNYSLKKLVHIRTNELEVSRNELQLIFDNIPEYILIINSEQKIINANEGLLKRTGFTIQDCLGESCEILLDKLSAEYKKLFPFNSQKEQRKSKIQVKIEKEIYEFQTHPIAGVGEGEQGTLITMRDITLDDINKKQLLLSAKMIAIGQLAAGMAHQIRNPLSIIRIHTYMLKENDNIEQEGAKSLEYIDDSVKKTGKIIDNVMNFWHVSDDQKSHINLKQSFEDIIFLHDNILKKKVISFEIDCNVDLEFTSNAEALKHILVNLVSNAIDAVEEGGELILQAGKKEKEIVISCCDNGCGIEESNMENLFNPFFTTKDPGKGTGLGLFIVYLEVEKLAGKILVESKVGKGTKFTVIIPDGGEEVNGGNV